MGTETKSSIPLIGIAAVAGVVGVALGYLLPRPAAMDSGGSGGVGGPVASINGRPVAASDFYRRLEMWRLPDGSSPAALVARQLVDEEMTLQFAQKQGVLPTDKEVDAKFADVLSKQPAVKEALTKGQRTEADIKRELRVAMALANVMTKGVTVTDDEVKQFYDQNVDKSNPKAVYYTPESVQVAIIAVNTQQDLQKAVAELAASKPFAEVARAYSVHESKNNGGLVPFVGKGGVDNRKYPGLEDVIFKMDKGQQATGVKIGNQFWIIRCMDKKPEETKAFEEVKEDARLGAMLKKGQEKNAKAMQEEFVKFRQSADIKALWPQYKDVLTTK